MSLLRENYGDVNRAFLQAFMSRRVMKVEDIRHLLAEILSADDEDHEISVEDINERIVLSYIAKANDVIHDFDLEIKFTLDQIDRSKVFALVNTASDELVQLATTHTADEIAFFKRVLDTMFETNNTRDAEVMAIHDFAAVRLHKNPQQQSQATQGATQSNTGLTMVGAEAALRNFVDEGWLARSKAGFYSLAPRALLELGPYLYQTYNTPPDEDEEDEPAGGIIERIKTCHACREIVTVGLRCSDENCKFRLHTPCSKGTFRSNRSAHECPLCKTEWTGGNPVGEQADRSQKRPRNRQPNAAVTPRAPRASSRSSATPEPISTRRSTRSRNTPVQEDDDEEDAPGESDEDDVMSG